MCGGYYNIYMYRCSASDSCYNDVVVVTEALTAKELVKLLWGELYVTPALFHIWIVSWADVW